MSARRALAACLVAVLTGLCAGCASATHSRTTRGATARPASRSPTTTTATTPSATATTTSSSALPGTGRPPVTIGDKNYTEQFVLGQLYLQALEAQGFRATIDQNIGPLGVTLQALKTGSLAMYPEYLDSFDAQMAGIRRRFATPAAALHAARRWSADHGLVLLDPTPFANTYAIAVTVAYARANRLRTLLDLRRVAATMTLAGPPQPARTTAPPAWLTSLENGYGVTPEQYRPLPLGSQYGALNSGMAQAAFVNTTDGPLASEDYRLLDDTQHVFGWGNVVPVLSAAVLAREGSAFALTIERVDATLTAAVMRRLNWAVDVAKEDPATVARQYLETHGLLAPLGG